MDSSKPATASQPSPAFASLLTAGFFGLALFSIFHQTAWSMVSIWIRSETYAHGFLILPIALWLIWNQWARLSTTRSEPAPWVAALMIPVGMVWLLAWLVDVLLVQQLALVSMLLIGVWAIVGHQLAKLLAFPLLFLFFAVPMGDSLIPPLMEFTATSTVWLVQQTGIPVYREGLYFSLPSGNWSVIEACSGQRYLIASVTLGVLYAYLTYFSFKRRALFVLASIIVPVFANAGRAYMIVMLGHLSGMTIATGVDHLIYGWVFFGLVMFLLFWLGSFFREDGEKPNNDEARQANLNAGPVSRTRLLATSFIVLLAAGIWPLLANSIPNPPEGTPDIALVRPAANTGWVSVNAPPWHWQPTATVAGQVDAYFERQGQTLGLFIQYQSGPSDEGEVVGSSGRFTKRDGPVRVKERSKVKLHLGDTQLLADQALLTGNSEDLLAWSWYRIGDDYTANDYRAKIGEAAGSLGLAPSGSYRIIVVTPVSASSELSQKALQNFLDTIAPRLDEALTQTLEPGR